MQNQNQHKGLGIPNRSFLLAGRRLSLILLATLGIWGTIAWWDDSTQRLILSLLALLTLLASSWRGRRGKPMLLALLAPLALAAAWQAAGQDLVRFATSPQVRVWNVFHYYLGAEYFGEIGYLDLYDAALLADSEADDYWRQVRWVRDQRSYVTEARDPARGALVRNHFSAERWRQFQDDLAALQPLRSAKKWRPIFTDRGYNASPFWTALIAPLTHWLPASRPWALKLLCSLDLLILAAVFVLIGRTFGASRGWLALLIFALNPVDRGRIVGGFLQYDWLLALTIAVCALRQRKAGWAAASLAFATLVRVFPLLLVGSLLVPALVRWIRGGRLRRDALRFALLYGLFMLVGLGIGCLTPRGPTAWGEFTGNILHHGEHHTFGEQRVGLKHLLTHRVTSSQLEKSSEERRQQLTQQQQLYRLVALLLLIGWFAAVHRRHGVEALVLGLIPFFALLVSSRYYWACLLLVPLVGRGQKLGGQALGAAGTILGGFSLFYLLSVIQPPTRYGQYLLFSSLLLSGLTLWLALVIRRELRYRARRWS